MARRVTIEGSPVFGPQPIVMTAPRSTQLSSAMAIAATPVALLIAPLFFHHSPAPTMGPYAAGYVELLVRVVLVGCCLVLLVGAACAKRGSRAPAWAFVSVLTLTSISCAAVEAVLRASSPEDSFGQFRAIGDEKSALMAFEMAPNRTWKTVDATVHSDPFGLRINAADPRWYERPFDPARYRIFTLGASSTFGFGLEDDQTWSHLLQDRLWRDLGVGANELVVVNAGNSGHSSLQILLRYYVRVAPLRPSCVVFYEGYNDLAPYKETPDFFIKLNEPAVFGPRLAEYVERAYAGRNLYMRTILAQRLNRGWKRAFGHDLWEPEESRKPKPPSVERLFPDLHGLSAIEWNAETHYLRNLRTLIEVARRDGTRVVLATFLHDPRKIYSPEVTEQIRYYNQRLRELAAAENVTLADLERDAEGADLNGLFFEDAYHPTPAGARYIAENLERTVLEVVAQDRSSRRLPAG